MTSATTPHWADMSAHMDPSQPPARRVLGDLTPRAINTPPRQSNSQSPLKQVSSLSPLASPDNKENAFGVRAHQTGCKRSIDKVDGVEHVAHAQKAFIGRDGGIAPSAAWEATETLDPFTRPSSRGSTTEPDSPASKPIEDASILEVPPEDKFSQESQESFSVFVNWSQHNDSQPTDDLPAEDQPIESQPIDEPPTVAERLRTVLGFSMYKVQTNQIDKSHEEILSAYDSAQQPVPGSTPPRRPCRDTVIHVSANLDPYRPIGKLFLGPHTTFEAPEEPPTCVSPQELMSPMPVEYTAPAVRGNREDVYETWQTPC